MRCAAFNTGIEFHALDHIAPLAEAIGMPLFVTEKQNYELARRYYPQVDVHLLFELELKLPWIVEQFDALFECKYWRPHFQWMLREFYQKEMRLVFCPHGQSDKGFKAPLLAPYAYQGAVFLYGELQIQMLKDLHIWPSISKHLVVGNYRLEFYQKYRSFYQELISREIALNPKKKTLLYAPTWRDAEGDSSFFKEGRNVIAQVPTDWNLIVKVHPLIEQRDPLSFYSIAALAEQKPNVFLVHECPLVYPFLAISDVYLGDTSSVGYDFLYFQRPLYFFPTEGPIKPLHRCGRILDPSKDLYTQIESKSNFSQREQQSLYQRAFASVDGVLRERVMTFLRYEPLPAHD